MFSDRKVMLRVVIISLSLVILGNPGAAAAQGKVVFESARDGNHEIYTMNADGSDQARLTNNPAFDTDAALSPDGTKVAFVSNRDGESEIYVLDIDSQTVARLTNNTFAESGPTWSPDGSTIAFSTTRDGNWEVYSMSLDGSGAVNLSSHPDEDTQPAFSPDGSKIAFISTRDSFYPRLLIMNADGTGPALVATTDGGVPSGPSFSPDGSTIVYSSGFPGAFHIHVINVGGGGSTKLTTEGTDNSSPTFSPDGLRIAFASNRNGDSEIYTMKADGANQTNVTVAAGPDFSPSWSRSGPPPILSGLSVGPVNEGGTATLTGTIEVPNAGETFDIRVNWGDGSAVETFSYASSAVSFSEQHVYGDNPTGSPSGNYTITVTVDDLDGGIDTEATSVTTNNTNPVITHLSLESTSVVIGDEATVLGQYTDAGYHGSHSDEQLTVFIDWGDGDDEFLTTTGSPGGFARAHTYAELGNYTVSVTVSDHDGGTTTQTINVAVVLPDPPAAPTVLRVDSISRDRMTIVWVDNSDNEDGFAVEACQNNGCTRYREIGRVAANITTFIDANLIPNTQYLYRVRAFNTGGFSAYSNKATGKTLRK